MSERDFPLPLRNSVVQLPIGTGLSTDDPREAAELASRQNSRSSLNLVKWAFSFPAMLAMTLVTAAFYAARQLSMDPDVWWHIKDGESILATHQWPTSDPYSFTVHGFPWIAFEWLGDVLLALALRFGGVVGLEILLFAMGAAVLLALYAYGTVRTGNSKAGFAAAAVLTPLALIQFNLRPQMIGYVFLILTLIILARSRQGKTATLWLLPLLMMVWVNTHASWLIGMGAVFTYWMAGLFEFKVGGIEAKKWNTTERKQISLAFFLSLILLNVNPYGPTLVAFPLHIQAGYPVSYATILEWFPMPFNQLGGKIFLFLVLGFVAAQVAYRFTWRLEELGLCLFSIAAACIHFRFLLLFVPFFTPILAGMFARGIPGYSRGKDKYILNSALIAGMILLVLYYFPTRADLNKRIADRFPVNALAFIKQHPTPGRMFDSYGFGGYLVWSGQTVFIDGRSELYEDGGVLPDYFQLTLVRPGGLDILRRYQIESCLLRPDEPLAVILAALPDWQKVYSDPTSAFFVRRSASPPSIAIPEEQASHGE